MKRYAKGGDIRYWSKEKIKLFEFMQKMGVPRKTDMLNVMLSVLSLNKAEPRILEIGGGLGAFTRMVFKKYPGARLVFTDGSSDMLLNAEKRLHRYKKQLTLSQININDPNWNKDIKGTFDAVVSSWCLHYLADTRQKPFFREIYHRLKPGGIFLFSCSVDTESRKFLNLYNGLEITRVKESFQKQGMEITEGQIRAMANKGHRKARINPARFEAYFSLIRNAGFSTSECIWKYLFNVVFEAYR
jgi:cyclopropane fatty-acyl-phospholipid synthase-like methyltransferase